MRPVLWPMERPLWPMEMERPLGMERFFGFKERTIGLIERPDSFPQNLHPHMTSHQPQTKYRRNTSINNRTSILQFYRVHCKSLDPLV